MSDQEKLKKPEHLKEEIWRQHLQWMDVMSKTAEVNFAHHVKQVKKNGGRLK